jgi:hypothetical protein
VSASASQPSIGSPVPRRALPTSPVTFDDLTADLIWPRLLGAARLAAAPARVGMSLFFLALASVLVHLLGYIDGVEGNATANMLSRTGSALRRVLPELWSLQWGAAARSIHDAFIGSPGGLLRESWWTAILGIPSLLALLGVAFGAVSRSCACEAAHAGMLKWTDALGFGVWRWKSLLGGTLGPMMLVWTISAALGVAGWVLFSLPVVNVLGSMLYALALIVGLFCALALVALAPGLLLMAPATACDGADAIDAAQRAYSYVLARPARLFMYAAVLLAQGLVALVVAALLVSLTLTFTSSAASAHLGAKGSAVVDHLWPLDGMVATPVAADATSTDAPAAKPLEGTWYAAARIIRMWASLLTAIVSAYLISFIFCGSTLLYLAIRRVVDGQDMDEIWSPGMVPGTMAKSGGSAAQQSTPPPAASQQSDAILDDGPADDS